MSNLRQRNTTQQSQPLWTPVQDFTPITYTFDHSVGHYPPREPVNTLPYSDMTRDQLEERLGDLEEEIATGDDKPLLEKFDRLYHKKLGALNDLIAQRLKEIAGYFDPLSVSRMREQLGKDADIWGHDLTQEELQIYTTGLKYYGKGFFGIMKVLLLIGTHKGLLWFRDMCIKFLNLLHGRPVTTLYFIIQIFYTLSSAYWGFEQTMGLVPYMKGALEVIVDHCPTCPQCPIMGGKRSKRRRKNKKNKSKRRKKKYRRRKYKKTRK